MLGAMARVVVSTSEAASLLGVTPSWVRTLVKRSALPGEKVGRDYLIPKEAVEEFARKPRARPGRPPKK